MKYIIFKGKEFKKRLEEVIIKEKLKLKELYINV